MADFLQKMQGSFSSLFSQKSVSVLGIDIGSAFLKVVQIKRKGGKAVLETYGELALGPYGGVAVGQATSLSPAKMAEAMKDLFRESNVTTQISGMAIPLGSSLLSLVEMPALDPKQLAQVVPIEARKYIPVPIGEVTLDWWVIPENPNAKKELPQAGSATAVSKVEVMIVAIHNDTIGNFQTISSSAGLQNSFFELEVFSSGRAAFGHQTAPMMIIDLGAGTTKISILEYGIIKTQHIINRGAQDITLALSKGTGISMERAEELKRTVGLLGQGTDRTVSETAELSLQYVFSEARRVLLNYERRYNKTVKNVVLAGGGALLKGILEFARKEMETETLLADPFAKIEAPAFLAPVLREAGPEFAVAIGVALRRLQETE